MTAYVPDDLDPVAERKAYADRLRAFAEFIEKHDDLPLPGAPEALATVGGTLQDQRDIIDFASATLDSPIHRWTGDGVERMSVRYRDEAGFRFTIYACASNASDYSPPPVLPLPPIFTAPTSPPPPVGGPSHPDGPAIPGLDEAPGDWKLTDGETDAILDLLGDDAKLYGYEDPAVTE